ILGRRAPRGNTARFHGRARDLGLLERVPGCSAGRLHLRGLHRDRFGLGGLRDPQRELLPWEYLAAARDPGARPGVGTLPPPIAAGLAGLPWARRSGRTPELHGRARRGRGGELPGLHERRHRRASIHLGQAQVHLPLRAAESRGSRGTRPGAPARPARDAPRPPGRMVGGGRGAARSGQQRSCGPPVRITRRPGVGTSVDAISKMNTALASPLASSVKSPEEISSEEVDLYTPGASVRPPRLPATMIAPTLRPAASLYAVVSASCASAAVGSAMCSVPLRIAGGKPVIAMPGLTPRSPVTVLAPVLVTAEPARISNVPSPPSDEGGTATIALAVVKLHTMLVASGLPARSRAPVVIVAV